MFMPFLAALLTSFTCLSSALAGHHAFEDELSPAVIEQVRKLEADYDIQLASVGPGYVPGFKRNTFDARPIDKGMLRMYLPVFLKEWQLYPTSLIRKTKLKRVLFCTELSVNGRSQGAAPDVESNTIFINLDPHGAISVKQVEQFLRQAIHHELFHYVDHQLDPDIHHDASWSMLNVKGFNYGDIGRRNRYDAATTNVTSVYPGFISQYSMINVAEDKAELFSRMMLNLHEMECRARDDVILGDKIDRLKQILKGYCPEMEDQFWQKIRYLDRPRLTPIGREDPWAKVTRYYLRCRGWRSLSYL